MIHALSLLLLAQPQGTSLKAHDLIYASENQMKQMVGTRTSPPKEPGIRFAHPGFYEVWIDAPGSGMKHLRMGLSSMATWQKYVAELGLGASHASAHPEHVETSFIPLYRNKLSLTGLKGLPTNASHKPWNVTFIEYAVANKARLRSLKAQIKAQPVGEGRNALIRSCYDWWSELDFTSP